MTTAIIIIIYLLSVWKVWDWIRKAHNMGGKWYVLETEWDDLLAVFFPVLNTIFAIFFLFYNPYKVIPKPSRNYNKFFKINKDKKCIYCNGEGGQAWPDISDWEKCPACKGSGKSN